MIWVDQIKEALPEYAKDTKLNLDCSCWETKSIK